jgi:sugar lactone lactonase YvrE
LSWSVLSRPLTWPRDRVFFPISPVLVRTEPGQEPAAMALLGLPSRHIGAKPRWATCASVTWAGPDRLMVVHMLTSTVFTYDFDGTVSPPRLELRHTLRDVTDLVWPDGIATSPDGRWAALSNQSRGTITVMAIDAESGALRPDTLATIGVDGDINPHGVAFSPDSKFIVYTTVDLPGAIRVVSLDTASGHDEQAMLTLVQRPDHARSPLAPKGVAFSPDGRFIAVSYGGTATRAVTRPGRGMIEIRTYDPTSGTLGEAISESSPSLPLRCGEDIAWMPDGRRLLVTDQEAERALLIDVEPATGAIGAVSAEIRRAASGLSLPHGCAASGDGRWIAVTNYGDATVRIFATPP